jgi:hypothetical protein
MKPKEFVVTFDIPPSGQSILLPVGSASLIARPTERTALPNDSNTLPIASPASLTEQFVRRTTMTRATATTRGAVRANPTIIVDVSITNDNDAVPENRNRPQLVARGARLGRDVSGISGRHHRYGPCRYQRPNCGSSARFASRRRILESKQWSVAQSKDFCRQPSKGGLRARLIAARR